MPVSTVQRHSHYPVGPVLHTKAREQAMMIMHDPSLSLLDKSQLLSQLQHQELSQPLAQPLAQQIQEFLDLHQTRIRAQSRWLELRLPERVLISAPDCVDILITSRMAHHIVMYARATKKGSTLHGVRLDADFHPMLLMQGRWKRWDEISKELVYDTFKECFVSRYKPTVCWNYICPEGIVPKDPFSATLYPVLRLSPDEHEELCRQAQTSGSPKTCILQVVTGETNRCSRNCLTENFLDCSATHVGLRLIDPDGNLYSFGLEMTPEGKAYINNNTRTHFATALAKVSIPDYAEHQYFDLRRITSIPITFESFKQIVQYVEGINRSQGTDFCILGSNCLSFAQKVLAFADVRVSCEESITRLFLRTCCCFRPVRALWSSLEPLFRPYALVYQCAGFVPSRLTRLVINLAIATFGGRKHMVGAGGGHFRFYIDLFSEPRVNHTAAFIAWQKKQNTQTLGSGLTFGHSPTFA